MQVKFLITGVSAIISTFFFLGCQKQPAPVYNIPTKQIQNTLVTIKTNWKNELNKEYRVGIKHSFTLPNKLGANPFLPYQKYYLKKQNHQTLLFKGFGVRNYLYLLVDNGKTIKELDKKAKKIGFNSLINMYDIYLDFFTNLDRIEFLRWLKQQNIDINKLFNLQTLNQENNKLIQTIYAPYLKYEGIYKPIILKKWGINKNGKFIFFTSKDYIPYALIIKAIKLKLNQK